MSRSKARGQLDPALARSFAFVKLAAQAERKGDLELGRHRRKRARELADEYTKRRDLA